MSGSDESIGSGSFQINDHGMRPLIQHENVDKVLSPKFKAEKKKRPQNKGSLQHGGETLESMGTGCAANRNIYGNTNIV